MSFSLNTSALSTIFNEEMIDVGGAVSYSFEDRSRLFTRAILPAAAETERGDRLKGGVALCATDTEIFVHPYVFRLVCTNGAIMARATQTRQIPREDAFAAFEGEVETMVRAAIRDCCSPQAFTQSVDQMRSARESAADMAIMMGEIMARHRGAFSDAMLNEIMRRYEAASDRSQYGLMNAVTSLARFARSRGQMAA